MVFEGKVAVGMLGMVVVVMTGIVVVDMMVAVGMVSMMVVEIIGMIVVGMVGILGFGDFSDKKLGTSIFTVLRVLTGNTTLSDVVTEVVLVLVSIVEVDGGLVNFGNDIGIWNIELDIDISALVVWEVV